MNYLKPFEMKEFTVAHDQCAMRVNTDGCLLGAVAGEEFESNQVQHVLDIGTGSGVIAAVIPGKCAAPPAPAIIAFKPRSRAVRAYWTNRSGVRFADTTLVS